MNTDERNALIDECAGIAMRYRMYHESDDDKGRFITAATIKREILELKKTSPESTGGSLKPGRSCASCASGRGFSPCLRIRCSGPSASGRPNSHDLWQPKTSDKGDGDA